MVIGTLSTVADFEPAPLEEAIKISLETIVEDGDVGSYGVDVTGSIDVSTPQRGTVHLKP